MSGTHNLLTCNQNLETRFQNTPIDTPILIHFR